MDNRNQFDNEIIKACLGEYLFVFYRNLETNQSEIRIMPENVSEEIKQTVSPINDEAAVVKLADRYIHPEDRDRVCQVFSDAFVLKELAEKKTLSMFFRQKSGKEEFPYLKLTVSKAEKMNETPKNIVYCVSLADAEVRIEKETKERMEFHLALLDGLSREYESLWLLDEAGKVSLFRVCDKTEAQEAAVNVYDHMDFEEGIGIYADKYVIEEDKQRLKALLTMENIQKAVPEEGIYSITFQRLKNQQPDIYLQICFSRATAPNGEKYMVIGIRNVDAIVRAENRKRELYRNAIKDREIDVMTGLRNRYCYEHAINRYSSKNCKWISCVYIDVDGLHEINNSEGHDAGDRLIKDIADEIVALWGNLNAFRTGGDEFIVFLFDWDTARLVNEIEQLTIFSEKKNYSISIGYSQDVLENLDIHYLIKDAEKMMYAEKLAHHRKMGIVRG